MSTKEELELLKFRILWRSFGVVNGLLVLMIAGTILILARVCEKFEIFESQDKTIGSQTRSEQHNALSVANRCSFAVDDVNEQERDEQGLQCRSAVEDGVRQFSAAGRDADHDATMEDEKKHAGLKRQKSGVNVDPGRTKCRKIGG